MNLIQSISLISNGTFATLTGEHYLSKIEVIKNNFLQFCIDLPSILLWNKAWKIYNNYNILLSTITKEINNNKYTNYDNYINNFEEKFHTYFHEYNEIPNLLNIIKTKLNNSILNYCIDTYGIKNIQDYINETSPHF